MTKKSSAQICLEYAVVRGLFGFLGFLPRKAAIGFSILLARLAYPFLGGLRRTGVRNLELAFPEKNERQREKILKKSFENLGRILGEVSQFPNATKQSLKRLVDYPFDSELRAEYEKLKSEGHSGMILISPHLGNWEMTVFAYSALESPLNYLARPLDNPLVENFTVRLRTRFGNRPINKTNSVSTAIDILRSGGILGILADVNSHPREGVFVPFFGIPACTTSGVAMLAMRTNALIIPICGVWDEENNRYKVIHGSIIKTARTGNRQQDVIETTALFTAAVENFVRQYPEQWLWIHKRWRSRPPGEKELY